MKWFCNILIGSMTVLLINSCNEETDKSSPYIGAWKTEVYTIAVDESGSLINQRMIIVMEETSFSDTLYHVIGHLEQPMICADGSIEQINEADLHLTFIRLGTMIGEEISWDSSGTPGFDSLFIRYIEPVLPAEFDAEYQITNVGLNFILHETLDTIYFTPF
jgi:hypothetical protein